MQNVTNKISNRGFMEVQGKINQLAQELTNAGQKEYARNADNCHSNFDRIAGWLGLSPEVVLLVYMMKHLDGIISYCQGHVSQREDVTGRILDARNYLDLLYTMALRDRGWKPGEPISEKPQEDFVDNVARKMAGLEVETSAPQPQAKFPSIVEDLALIMGRKVLGDEMDISRWAGIDSVTALQGAAQWDGSEQAQATDGDGPDGPAFHSTIWRINHETGCMEEMPADEWKLNLIENEPRQPDSGCGCQ